MRTFKQWTPGRTRCTALLLASLAALAGPVGGLSAQEKIQTLPQSVDGPATTAPAPMLTLDDCLALAFEKQPALAAARASLAAAQDSRQALNNLPCYARLLARDLPVRKQQACHGITIAQAGLLQAEWETRYSVTRNYYTIIYVRMQQSLLNDLIGRLERGRKTAKRVLDAGEVTKVTKIDLDNFGINIDVLKIKKIEADVGVQKAYAALREAIGVGPEYPLEISGGHLPPVVEALSKDDLIAQALANRGEITQANSARRVTELEVEAQALKTRGLRNPTFASASDIHARPIPQGVFNNEYRPGAIGLEMPTTLVGRRDDRVARAEDFNMRAGAVVDKTYNLVALETENYYLKWVDARDRVKQLAAVQPKAQSLADTIDKRLQNGNASGEEYIRATTTLDQIRASYNDALYNHALALTALERITAGGFRIDPSKR
jgi:outer membrane protein TolC